MNSGKERMLLELCLLKILYIFSISNECSGRIINGAEAGLLDLRYIVSIRKRKKDASGFGNGHTCGGSLIKPNVVLTAAHCFANLTDGSFFPPSLYTVVMGCLNTNWRDNYTMIFDIEKVITYKKKFDSLEGDIALVFLRGWVPRDHPIMQPISINRKKRPKHTRCHVSGWGLTEENVISNTLKRVNVPIVDSNVCTKIMNASKVFIGGVLCAGHIGGRFGICIGDSGGPLVCGARLTGIVSWCLSCTVPLLPGFYTDVAFYSSWIDKHLNPQPEEMIIGNNTNRLEDHLIVFLIVAFKTHAVLFRKRYPIFTF